ncbi:MAG TPA: hypothetical protein PK323_05585 [Bacteroidia bacterium]|nr:hypothetical protein [Bacteroidia bacterium]
MKTLFTLLACILFSAFTYAQKCTFNKEETDSKTGLQIKSIMTSVTNQFIVWTIKNGANYQLGLEITMPELQKENILKGDTLTILLTNNETILAFAIDKYLPVGKADEMIEATNYFPYYGVTSSDWLKLCATNIQYMKVTFGKEYVGFDVNESKAKKIKAAAVCVK